MSESPCELFLMDLGPDSEVILDASGIFWNGRNLTNMDIAYVHGFSYMNPVIPSANTNKDWSSWQQDYLIDQQKDSFLYSVLAELERYGVTLINPPNVHLDNFMKPFLLEKLRRAGFLIPNLLCSNDMQSVKAFCSRNERTVWRPVSGRAAWQLFLDKQRDHLIRKDSPPVLLAEAVKGPFVRGFLYDDEPLLMLKCHSPDPTPPERLERFHHMECFETQDALKRLSTVTGARWALVHFVLTEKGPWIYDIDVDPILDWLPDVYRKDVTAMLAARLVGRKDKGCVTVEKNTPRERPTLFLRQMLRILFEFEKSKYGS